MAEEKERALFSNEADLLTQVPHLRTSVIREIQILTLFLVFSIICNITNVS